MNGCTMFLCPRQPEPGGGPALSRVLQGQLPQRDAAAGHRRQLPAPVFTPVPRTQAAAALPGQRVRTEGHHTALARLLSLFVSMCSHVIRQPLRCTSLCVTPACFSNIQKFVSTTLRPTMHPELHSWQDCASFVADFLSLELLDPPTELVRNAPLSCSTLTLWWSMINNI